MDYIAEANKFMYDDNYVTEAKVIDAKKFGLPSGFKAEPHFDLDGQYFISGPGTSNLQISYADGTGDFEKGFEVSSHDAGKDYYSGTDVKKVLAAIEKYGDHMSEVTVDAVFSNKKESTDYVYNAKRLKVKVTLKPGSTNNAHLVGLKSDLETFISHYHDDGTGKPEELKHIKPIK